LDIPDSKKGGILTPVLKKGKDKNIPGNNRGIVVTNTFSKILESIIKDRLEEQLKKTQNPLQRGFTEKASPMTPNFAPSVLIVRLLRIVLLYLLYKRIDSFSPCRIPCAMLILSVRY
jgi:hypothetical protein